MPSKKISAGILLFRRHHKRTEVLLVHPGGPFWIKKDAGTWTIPKGEIKDQEDPLEAAKREMLEETGIRITGACMLLTPVNQKSGKQVMAWASEGDVDPAEIKSNYFELEWPPRSGNKTSFPEIDKAAWFDLQEARVKIHAPQQPFLVELDKLLRKAGGVSQSGPGG